MRAIILAAGRGGRLEPSGHWAPKCLLEFGGVSLLERHLRNLATLGVEDVRVCVGYRRDLIAGAITGSAHGARVSTAVNPDFTEGSIVSLWVMRAALDGGDDVLLMDADVLYAPAILERLVRSAHASCVLLDRDFVPGDEPVKVCTQGGRIMELSKRIAPGLAYDTCGESVGFFKLSPRQAAALAGCTERYVEGGRRAAPHEVALRDLVL